MSRLPDIPDESALARLFTQARVQEEAMWFSLPGGQTLFSAGDRSEQLYFVRAGRLGAFRREQGHESQFLGVIRPGEPAGEMSLIADEARTASAELQRLADRDEIGADLRHHVIHRLFNHGLELQVAAGRITQPTQRLAVEKQITEVDAIIRDIRNVVFALNGNPLQESPAAAPDRSRNTDRQGTTEHRAGR